MNKPPPAKTYTNHDGNHPEGQSKRTQQDAHTDQTKVMDGTFVRIMAWYDNEWGFSTRMADTAIAMAKLI